MPKCSGVKRVIFIIRHCCVSFQILATMYYKIGMFDNDRGM